MPEYADLAGGYAELKAVERHLFLAAGALLEGGGAQPIIGHVASLVGVAQDLVGTLVGYLEDALHEVNENALIDGSIAP
jgi:hypothetical protein